MAAPPSESVHIRCACGQRLRLKNPQPGQEFSCPRCGNALSAQSARAEQPLSDSGDSGLQLVALPSTNVSPPREATLIDAAVLRVAPHGSGIGLTGRLAHQHVEALLATARAGRPLDVISVGSQRPRPGARGGDVLVSTPVRSGGSFLDDVLATFYFVGSWMNAAHVLVTALICTLVLVAAMALFSKTGFLLLINVVCLGLAMVVAVQFFWSVLSVTAAGDDDLPLVAPDWDLWADVVRPTVLLLIVTLLCALPVVCVQRYLPSDMPGFTVALVAAAVLGMYFWPMAVLSAAISNTLSAARPDLALRSIVRIGWPYLIAWGALLMTAGSWIATYAYRDRVEGIRVIGPILRPLLEIGLTYYYGYALFRILGLLYRHYEDRLAWR